jgi:hypothetical protein
VGTRFKPTRAEGQAVADRPIDLGAMMVENWKDLVRLESTPGPALNRACNLTIRCSHRPG